MGIRIIYCWMLVTIQFPNHIIKGYKRLLLVSNFKVPVKNHICILLFNFEVDISAYIRIYDKWGALYII